MGRIVSATYASMHHLAEAINNANDELESLVDRLLDPSPRRWICAAVSSDTHPYRITDGRRDLGHYATIENARRALEEMR